jgi:hypothetical protein
MQQGSGLNLFYRFTHFIKLSSTLFGTAITTPFCFPRGCTSLVQNWIKHKFEGYFTPREIFCCNMVRKPVWTECIYLRNKKYWQKFREDNSLKYRGVRWTTKLNKAGGNSNNRTKYSQLCIRCIHSNVNVWAYYNFSWIKMSPNYSLSRFHSLLLN